VTDRIDRHLNQPERLNSTTTLNLRGFEDDEDDDLV
jgi:hypothetical protein